MMTPLQELWIGESLKAVCEHIIFNYKLYPPERVNEARDELISQLPVSFGQTLWEWDGGNKKIREWVVESIWESYSIPIEYSIGCVEFDENDNDNDQQFKLQDVGGKLKLTREEAEAERSKMDGKE